MSRESEPQAPRTGTREPTQRELLSFLLLGGRRRNPYPLYELLRDGGPVLNTAVGVTTVCSMDAAIEVLRDPTMSSDPFNASLDYRAGRAGTGILREAPGRFLLRRRIGRDRSQRPFARLHRSSLTRMDAPEHTRVREAAARAFTPEVLKDAATAVEQIANELIDSFERSGRAELLSQFAYELPLRTICHLLGVPASDHSSFSSWAVELIRAFETQGFGSEKVIRRGDLAAVAMSAYISALAAQRRSEPRNDLISTLAAPDESGRYLSGEELSATVAVILAAGHETTANLIGNAVWALHKNLAQRQRFVDEPDLGRSAVEEFLRYESPVQLVQRAATVDREHHGVLIPAGRPVLVLLGAANRDPAHFRDPQRLDIARNGTHPLAFGFGAHHCIGAALATTEALIGLRVLYDRLPGLRPTIGRARWRSSIVFRGLERLPVVW